MVDFVSFDDVSILYSMDQIMRNWKEVALSQIEPQFIGSFLFLISLVLLFCVY